MDISIKTIDRIMLLFHLKLLSNVVSDEESHHQGEGIFDRMASSLFQNGTELLRGLNLPPPDAM